MCSSDLLWCATIAALVLLALASLQSRWLLNAAAAQIPMVLIVIGCWVSRLKPLPRWIVACLLIGIIYVPPGVTRYLGAREDVTMHRVSTKDVNSMLFRDIAAALRKSQPTGELTVLSSPNGSTAIGYYGLFRTLGTLYWENNAGLKAAGAILAARSEVEAAELVRRHGITHIAIVAEENFISQYFLLLNPGATAEDTRKCFGHQLLLDKAIPQWLQILPYKVPDDLAMLKPNVMLFKVAFNQNAIEALYNIALAQIASGENPAAEKTLDKIITEAPHNPQPWLRMSELLLGRKEWAEGKRYALEGAARTNPQERRLIVLNVAEQLYRGGQSRLASEVYQGYLKDTDDIQVRAYLTWILATSKDDSLRDGEAALRMAQELVQQDAKSALHLSILAAALAENSRTAEATTACDKALDLARKNRETPLVEVLEKRAQIIRSGQPIRE